MLTRKQRKFKELYGFYITQYAGRLVKIEGKRILEPTRSEIVDYLGFTPPKSKWVILDDFKWFFNLFGLKRKRFELFKAKLLADAKSKANSGRRYYVFPDWNGKLQVLSRGDVKKLQAKGIMSKKVTFMDLVNEAVYYTKNQEQTKKKATPGKKIVA